MGLATSGPRLPVIPLYQGKRPPGTGTVDMSLVARARPTSSSEHQLLPVLPALGPLFPWGGLRRGGVVVVGVGDGTSGGTSGAPGAPGSPGGATTLAFALLAAASAASWCGAVGPSDPGVVALAEMGLHLDHVVFVPDPGPRWPEVAATFFDGMDVVLVCPPSPVRPGVARRLAARARERRSVLVVLARARAWPEGPDIRLTVGAGAWHGPDSGHGYLRGRRVEVVATGRRGAARGVRVPLWLPTSSGTVAPAGSDSRESEPRESEP